MALTGARPDHDEALQAESALLGLRLTETLYLVAAGDEVQLWCTGCCNHGDAARANGRHSCMALVAAHATELRGVPRGTLHGTRYFGSMAQLVAYAVSGHTSCNREPQRVAARPKLEPVRSVTVG